MLQLTPVAANHRHTPKPFSEISISNRACSVVRGSTMNAMKTGLLVLQELAFGRSGATDDSGPHSWVRLVMDGQAIEFLDGNGQHGGDSPTGAFTFVHGYPVAPEVRRDNYL